MTATAPGTAFVSKAPKLGLVGGFDGMRGIGVCAKDWRRPLPVDSTPMRRAFILSCR